MPEIINRVHFPKLVDDALFDGAFKVSFADIIEKDSKGKHFGLSIHILSMRCIDIDAVELARTRQLDKTMDCCVGIGTFDPIRRSFSGNRLLLVELKLNCDHHNLGSKDYTGKINHTRAMLSVYNLHPKNIFVFDDNDAYVKAKRDVAQWCRSSKGQVMKTVVVLNPQLFNDYIGFDHQFPYNPLTKSEDIINSLKNASSSVESLNSAIETWKDKALQYLYQGNKLESTHIEKVLVAAAKPLIDSLPDEEDRILLSLVLPVTPHGR